MRDVRVAIQDTFGEWWDGDSHEGTDEDVEAIRSLIADTLTGTDGCLSIDVGAKTRYFPVRNIVQVEIDVRRLDDREDEG